MREKIERGDAFVLVDVLGELYCRHSHLPRAINLPLDDLEMAPEVLSDKDAEIDVYYMSTICPASEEAARELAAMGYHNVRGYTGRKPDWIKASLTYDGAHTEKEQR